MRWFLLFCLLPAIGLADDHWVQFRSGPFEVFTDAGARAGRETLMRFEQFRNAVGKIVGDDDLQAPKPVRILLFKDAKDAAAYPATAPVLNGRDRYAVLLNAKTPVPPAVFAACTRLMLEANTARMPAEIERGLVALFSTIDVTGIRITLGRPVPPNERTKDWARMHLLAVDPEYYGKLRVLIFNLRKGVDEGAAYRNAFGKSSAEIEKQTEQYLAAGNFQTTEISSRPLAVTDFPEREAEPAAVRLALADLLLPQSRAAYEALIRDHVHAAEAWEGLGLIALRDKQTDAARADFSKALEADSQSADAYVEYAKLEPDNGKAVAALEKAVKLNAKLAEPHFLMARRAADPETRAKEYQAAASLEPRNAAYWQALAEEYLAQKNFGAAAKAWTAGEQAAADPAERARMKQARLAIERQRLDYEAAERKRTEEENQRELEALKAKARADLHALEAKANQGEAPAQPGEKVVPWWDGPKPSGHARGILKQVDCIGKQARLVIQGDDGKLIKLLIPDASQVTIMGGGNQALSCGPQKPRPISVEYFPKTNAKLATVGEVATMEMR